MVATNRLDALLNEYKGNIFEYLTCQFVARYYGVEKVFLENLTEDMLSILEQQESYLRNYFPYLLKELPKLADLTAKEIKKYLGEKSICKVSLLGKVLAKVMFDGQTIAAPFPASFFKQLLGLPVAFRDLEEYDHELYRQLYSNVLNKELTPEYSQALSLDFHGLVEGGADRPVTDSNKREYLRLVAVQKLVGERAPQFEALVRGFNIFRFHSHLHRFNASDLMVLISGPTDITADMVLDNVDFNHGNWRNSKTLDHVRQYIRSLSPSKIKEFLQFATGSPSLPLGGLGQVAEEEQPSMGKITFTRLPKSDRLPEAHTCFNCIDLSDYQDYNILERNFEIAIGNYAETFDLL